MKNWIQTDKSDETFITNRQKRQNVDCRQTKAARYWIKRYKRVQVFRSRKRPSTESRDESVQAFYPDIKRPNFKSRHTNRSNIESRQTKRLNIESDRNWIKTNGFYLDVYDWPSVVYTWYTGYWNTTTNNIIVSIHNPRHQRWGYVPNWVRV